MKSFPSTTRTQRTWGIFLISSYFLLIKTYVNAKIDFEVKLRYKDNI